MINLQTILEEQIVLIENQINQTKRERDNSATPMESHHDQTRSSLEHLVYALEAEQRKLMHLMKVIQNLPKFTNRVQINSTVVTSSLAGINRYLIVPDGLGGKKIDETPLLSDKSPLAMAMTSLSSGDDFVFNGDTFRIISVENNEANPG